MTAETTTPISALLVEPNVVDASLIQGALSEAADPRIELTTVRTLEDGIDHLERTDYDVVLVDISTRSRSDQNALEAIRRIAPDTPCVALAAVTDEALAIKSLSLGAQDYLIKVGPYYALLTRAIRYAIERGRAEARHRERERYFRSIIENVSDIIAVVDESLTFRYVSPAVERVCALPQVQLIGRPVANLVHPEDLPIVAARTADRLRGGDDPAVFTEVRARHGHGGWRWLQLRAACYREEDGEPVVVVTARDVTETRRLEEALRRANNGVSEPDREPNASGGGSVRIDGPGGEAMHTIDEARAGGEVGRRIDGVEAGGEAARRVDGLDSPRAGH